MSKFLKAKRERFVVKKERYEAVEPASKGKRSTRAGLSFEAGRASGVAAESCFGFQTPSVDFKQIWSDDLPYLVAARGGGSMSYEIIGISGSDLFKHHSVVSAAASIAVPSGSSNISLNVLEAVGKRPCARAPDRPSSTR